ncbi:DDE-type integrase/transposase/recombinase [Croceicoccus mobilis]|uniref:Integrase catalytic domain-containing protein n=1 Tax=Croceicoccus mobilis TaxID=1703339 RepID=A0A916Z9M3_9SPHN|nr:DDE-type integrase/transposase/recombinase [Croceicoccus mobilis]GGD83103.1 hypothetical protein GCM10010990_36460 [Croceicoccus mobilis]
MFYIKEIFRLKKARRARVRSDKGPGHLNFLPNLEGEALAKDRIFRVVYTEHKYAVVFDLASKGGDFYLVSQATLDDWEGRRQIERVREDDFVRIANGSSLTPVQIQRRDMRYELIRPLITTVPDVFDRLTRARMISKHRAELEVCSGDPERKNKVPCAKSIKSYLELYWRNGMSPDALIPKFEACGSPGNGKARRTKPLGRKREIGGGNPHMPMNDDVEAVFKWATDKYYRKAKRGSLSRTFRTIQGYLQTQFAVDESGGGLVARTRADRQSIPLPTFRQYQYWYEKQARRFEDRIAREGATKVKKDSRSRLGTTLDNLIGIGSRFEIDATTIDVGCVSETNRRAYVGRPTLYLVVDVYSKMIVGMHLTLESASWREAGIAIRNIAEDKVEYCRRFDIEIEHGDWPVRDTLPARIIADRGELENYEPENFIVRTGVTIENTAPYRGDMKGNVEKRFDMVHAVLRDVVPGMFNATHSEKGDSDARREAKLTLKELTAAVVRAVIYLNNNNFLAGYHPNSDMIKAGIDAIPKDIWNWALETGRTELRATDLEMLKMAVLKTGNATSTKDGISFMKMLFISDAHIQGRVWENTAAKSVKLSYDHKDTNKIWLHQSDGTYEECRLSPACKAFANMTFKEADTLSKRVAEAGRSNSAAGSYAWYLTRRNIEDIGDQAIEATGGKLSPASLRDTDKTKQKEKAVNLEAERHLSSAKVKS